MNEKVEISASTSDVNIVCEEILDISGVNDLRNTLLEAYKSNKPVVVNGSAVQRADTAALQLLGAFFQDAKINKQEIHWKDPSDTLCASAELLGLSILLGLETGV